MDGICNCKEGWFGKKCDVSSCTSNQFLDQAGNCVASCTVNGQYENTFNRRCENCHYWCARCNGGDTYQCLTCIGGRFLYQGQCLTACPSGYYAGKIIYIYTIVNFMNIRFFLGGIIIILLNSIIIMKKYFQMEALYVCRVLEIAWSARIQPHIALFVLSRLNGQRVGYVKTHRLVVFSIEILRLRNAYQRALRTKLLILLMYYLIFISN